STEERIEAIRASVDHLAGVRVESFDGLLVDYARQAGAQAIVRGLRATADFEYEFQMAMVNRRLRSDVETVFLMTRWDYSYLSSSIVKEVATLGGEFRELVPGQAVPIIEAALRRRNAQAG
ncbi:MAG TPA: pantetheine-phosphate adenylyltransferase, partial [Fimbriimonadaceae bacterium]|nr:pantetheine-phosphate adenylyltransferase [Fimbriimonadaceae bacterium]